MGRVFKKGKYWYVDYVADGRRHREKHGKYKKLAELHINEIELQIAREELRIPNDAAIDKFFENFLNCAEAHVRPKTLEKHRTVISNFEEFRSKFKSVNILSKVSRRFVEEFKLSRLNKVSMTTVNHDVKVLSIIFNHAVEKNLLRRNPVKDVKRFSVETRQDRFFSREEIRKILDNCSQQMYSAYMILLHTGMRKGELANLEWDDVDLERRIIKVGPKDGWSPKGNKGTEIPINDDLHEVLIRQRGRSTGTHVVEKANKKPYYRGLWLKFKRLARKLGIKDANIHTFRHTFASYLVMKGIDILTVKELLGHSDITMTMRYAHLIPSHKM
jgi:integrase